jgi:hypothetical protein
MTTLSNEQLASVILMQHETKVRAAIKKQLAEIFEPASKGHAHFDGKMLNTILQIVEGN